MDGQCCQPEKTLYGVEPVKLKYLFKDLPVEIKGSKETEVTGVVSNSMQVKPGDLFLAKKGLTHDAAKFIPDAVRAGAAAVATDLYDPFLDCVQIICPDVQSLEPIVANRFYGYPAERLFLVGITGTNGKTTTSYLIKHLLDQEKELCGLVGTIEWIVGKNVLASTHTTPDLLTLTKLFHDMAVHECQSAVMEVSSHALDQARVAGVPFDAAVFTNLTLDHLDYHKTMEEYAAAKAKLFSMIPKDGHAIFNIDDPWHERILENCQAKRISYGFSENADIRASHMALTAQGMKFVVEHQQELMTVASPLIGRFNVYNLLAAIGVAIVRHLPLHQAVDNLATFSRVPGRLERVANPRGLNIFVDYAHTDDALRNVLETLQEFKTGRIITVFGCGGNRDATKRPKMASVAEIFSDVVIVTSDNPRHEDPEAIVRQIVAGFRTKERFTVVLDRKEAIHKAVALASPEDIVLIAGKGHETYQIFSNQTFPFDDREVARQAAIC